VYDRPSRFEFTATGGPIGTPDDDPHLYLLAGRRGYPYQAGPTRSVAAELVTAQAEPHSRRNTAHIRNSEAHNRQREVKAGGLSRMEMPVLAD
jgi:hypothetical protein